MKNVSTVGHISPLWFLTSSAVSMTVAAEFSHTCRVSIFSFLKKICQFNIYYIFFIKRACGEILSHFCGHLKAQRII